MKDVVLNIDDIYVPAKRRRMADPAAIEALAASILEEGQKVPITVRRDGERFVLVEGLQRLEACRALGERTIAGVVVGTRKF